MIEIVAPGPLTTVQDGGRRGYADLGVPRSGAFDAAAYELGNRLVGNPVGAAALETTYGGLSFRCRTAMTLAFTGAPCPGAPDWGAAVSVPAGTEVRLGAPRVGLRSYVAVRGGIAVPRLLGSRSTDVLSGLGPRPLATGDRLPVGSVAGSATTAVTGATAVPTEPRGSLTIRLGPRDDWFSEAARERLLDTAWTVRPECDRVGVRLEGPALERSRTGELPSEPMRPGAVQVPPDGRPIVFGPDAPVTGGYPVIAVVLDLAAVAQLRPGETVRFSRAAGGGWPTSAPPPRPRPGS